MNKILVVVKNPNQLPEIREIDNGLKSFKDIVEGYLEAIPGVSFPFVGYCNEEGVLQGLEVNVYFYGEYIVGPILLSTLQRASNGQRRQVILTVMS